MQLQPLFPGWLGQQVVGEKRSVIEALLLSLREVDDKGSIPKKVIDEIKAAIGSYVVPRKLELELGLQADERSALMDLVKAAAAFKKAVNKIYKSTNSGARDVIWRSGFHRKSDRDARPIEYDPEKLAELIGQWELAWKQLIPKPSKGGKPTISLETDFVYRLETILAHITAAPLTTTGKRPRAGEPARPKDVVLAIAELVDDWLEEKFGKGTVRRKRWNTAVRYVVQNRGRPANTRSK